MKLGQVCLISMLAASMGHAAEPGLTPGSRVLLDAHNCYPYGAKWSDRIDRALSTGVPLAIEQDLDWVDGKSIVSHGRPYTGDEPDIQTYFFERIRPIVEAALAGESTEGWPLITLNIDFKNSSREHLSTFRNVLTKYEDWLCTAAKTEDIADVSPLRLAPVLVLVGSSNTQEQVFHDDVLLGGKLCAFGAANTEPLPEAGGANRNRAAATVPPDTLLKVPANNYRRWWNNSWFAIEEGGARNGGEWTLEENARLKAFADRAHELGYWIRFYTLNGHAEDEGQGWSAGYNFGSLDAAKKRWTAAIEAGVDFIATDQYEDFAANR